MKLEEKKKRKKSMGSKIPRFGEYPVASSRFTVNCRGRSHKVRELCMFVCVKKKIKDEKR